jgi:MoaA/NifB/PqqE/SkfB family radical SAM enzyme
MVTPKYCSLLWKHISNEPLGHVRTCCIARERVHDENGKPYTLGETSVRDIFHSEYYRNIRQAIRSGGMPANCEPCWQDERNGKKSKREIYNEYAEWRYGPIDWDNEPDMPEDFQLILSTTCNLKCRSCNPGYSSKWVKEADERGLPYVKESVNVSLDDMQNSRFWTEINDWLPHIKYLEVMGGEPLYMKEFRQFVDKLVADGISKNVHLNFSTNGTTLNKTFMNKMLKNFASVGFNVSIDSAVKKRFEYLRHGADWNEVRDNLDYYHELHVNKQAHVGITCTVTALNVMYLAEFHSIFAERWPEFRIFHNTAFYPSWYNPSVFPEECKPDIVKPVVEATYAHKYIQQDIDGIVKFVLTPRKETVKPYGDQPTDTVESEIAVRWRMFVEQVVAGDVYRKENFRECFPELYTILLKNKKMNYPHEHNIAKLNPRYGALEAGKVI